MEPYHSKDEYPFLRVQPYGSNLEDVIAETAVYTVKAKGVFVLMIVIT